MAVYYNKEKSKVGTLTGTVITWARQLSSNDIGDTSTLSVLPQGYLRCDGTVYSAELFPLLAEVLGTGNSCRFRKEGQTLLDNQFQVPDYGSKSIRASTGSNLGTYLDIEVVDDAGATIKKSGVGLEVLTNVGTLYEVLYQGSMFLPSQVLEIPGQPGFSKSTGSYTETSEVLAQAMQPHAHFHDGSRTRVRANASTTGLETQANCRNFAFQRTTIEVCSWFGATTQELCRAAASKVATGGGSNVKNYNGCNVEGYAACFSGCTFHVSPSNRCLIPNNCSVAQGCDFPISAGSTSCGFGAKSGVQQSTCGSVTYSGTFFTECVPTVYVLGVPGCAVGGPPAYDFDNVTLPANYNFPELPFDASVDSDVEVYAGVSNVIQDTVEFGNEGIHKHELPLTQDPHTYVVTTTPTFVPSDELSSRIRIDVNESKKYDAYIQPYIVQEFLIKV